MISSFEKYIKAAIDSKKYSVVCEMANVVHSDKNHINIMTYPGRDVRVYKNRDDEVQILCPKNISYVQESNLTKAISTGTIFDDADEVDRYAGFIVKTKMPIDAMTNKGLENPYKLREVVGSTIGVMNEDGEVDVSDADVDNGNNIIDDLLEKDSKEFKDVKNVVDDYLDNDDHSFGYDTDFTTDIQQLRDEINRFKDADISPEDSITDADWDDNWGSTSSIMGDHTDAEDEENEDDTHDKDEDDIEVSDDDDEDENPEDITQEEYDMMVDPDEYVQEGVISGIKVLHKIGYDPKTKTFITDIPANGGVGSKIKCKLQIGGTVKLSNPFAIQPVKPAGPTFYAANEVSGGEPLLYLPVTTVLKGGKDLLSVLKHEEGHFYISTDRANFNKDFDNATKLVGRHSSKLSDHGNAPEEYVADLYSANKTGVENYVAMLKKLGFQNRKACAKLKVQLNHKWVTRFIKILRQSETNPAYAKYKEYAYKMKKSVATTDDMIEYVSSIHGITKAGPGEYAKRLNDTDKRRVDVLKAGRAVANEVSNLEINVKSILSEIERQTKLNTLTYDDWEKMLHKSIDTVHKRIDEFKEAFDYEIKARIYFIRKYGNKATQESYSMSSPAYKMNPNHKAAFLNTDDDDIDNDTDVSYNMKKECGDGSISSNPSSGGNVNTTMEDGDTTTPMPAFSSGSGTDIQTESDEVDEESDDPEYKVKFVKSKGNLRDKDNNAEECLAKLKELVHGDIPEDYIEGIMNAEAKDLMNKYSNGIIEVPDFDEFIVSGLCPIDEVIDYNESMPDRFSDDCSVFIVGTSDYDMRFIVLDTNDGKYYLVYMDYHGSDGFFKYPIASSFKELIEVLEKAKALDDERWDELIKQSKEKVGESFTPKAVVPDDLDTAPSDGHNPLLSPIHEGFMMKRPKKLKAIDIRGIVSYVTIEMNDIKDANDQAMIAGYVCSKLELIDFYITVLDTHDDRYVVPHTRQYLVDGQRQLSDLLTRILKIRPINRSDRIWQIEKII
jgi:hypothetical protein